MAPRTGPTEPTFTPRPDTRTALTARIISIDTLGNVHSLLGIQIIRFGVKNADARANLFG